LVNFETDDFVMSDDEEEDQFSTYKSKTLDSIAFGGFEEQNGTDRVFIFYACLFVTVIHVCVLIVFIHVCCRSCVSKI
jgi:hypothetical protein